MTTNKLKLLKAITTIAVVTATSIVSASDDKCAEIREYEANMSDKVFFSADILKINGQPVRKKYAHFVAEGKHVLTVKEQIQSSKLSNTISRRFRIKELTINATCGEKYTIAAEFNEDNRRDRDRFWQPVVKQK